jgi:hypothetical protein
VDRVHLGVLVGLVELDAAGDADDALGRRETVADRLGVGGAAPDDVGDQMI